MKLSYVFLLVAPFIVSSQAVSESTVQIDTAQISELDNYPWITYMSSGPIDWIEEVSDNEIQGRSYRVVIAVYEIYTSVYVEEITIGDEGCCVKVASTRKLDLEQLYKYFGFNGETSGFNMMEWKSTTSFEFSIHEKRFLATDVGEDKVTVQKL